MKQLLLLSCIFILFGCKGKEKTVVYPKFVKNTFNYKWAIEANEDVYIGEEYPMYGSGERLEEIDKWMIAHPNWTEWRFGGRHPFDRKNYHNAGKEYQFADSMTAVNYWKYCITKWAQEDKVFHEIMKQGAENNKQFIKEHSYKTK